MNDDQKLKKKNKSENVSFGYKMWVSKNRKNYFRTYVIRF